VGQRRLPGGDDRDAARPLYFVLDVSVSRAFYQIIFTAETPGKKINHRLHGSTLDKIKFLLSRVYLCYAKRDD
jgi:hypothetical protein